VDWNELKGACAGRVLLGIPAGPFTSYHLGGDASAWVTPKDTDDLAACMAWLHARGAGYLPIGGGSNLLLSDAGFDGAVVHLGREFQGVEVEGRSLRVKAGTPLQVFLRRATDAGLGGFEHCAGVPGLVCGAVVGNAGSRKDWIGSRVESLTVVTREGEVRRLGSGDVSFDYRHTSLQETGWVLTEVVLRGDPALPADIDAKVADYLRERKAKQPWAARSAGSVFRNPEGSAAGRLIEEVGLKGYRVGGARVSEVHANFIVSDGGWAADVAAVMREAQRRVWEERGIRLVPEILPAGDWDWPSVSDIWWHRTGPYGFKAGMENS
jgi:UDP-N-acetylmuramate dehydrogenase